MTKPIALMIQAGAGLLVSACGSVSAPTAPAANIAQAPAPDTRQAQLAAIADRCGLSRASLQLNGDELRFQPPSDAHFEAVDCSLREIRARGLDAGLTMGFVGNELPDTKTKEGARR